MKQIDKMSRLTGELEKIFRLLNHDFFNDELPTPVLTVIPTPKAYAHYVPYDIWNAKGEGKREINIASGTLDRPLENIVASLLHECVHFYCDCILNVQDTSNKGVYHNHTFAREAERHGLTVTRSDKYGYSHTEPSDPLLEWVLLHDELREIEMCRANPSPVSIGIGVHRKMVYRKNIRKGHKPSEITGDVGVFAGRGYYSHTRFLASRTFYERFA